jgi:hypothetical protein
VGGEVAGLGRRRLALRGRGLLSPYFFILAFPLQGGGNEE